jgi:hypothetical protein
MVETRRRKAEKEPDRCGDISEYYAVCEKQYPSIPTVKHNRSYSIFLKQLLKNCEPYTGKRVFVIWKSGSVEYVCPEYKLKIGQKYVSLSVAANGYIYLHLLKDYLPFTEDCVFKGDHITIAPTKESHLHFHVTRIHLNIEGGQIVGHRSQNTSFCTIPISDLEGIFGNTSASSTVKKEEFMDLVCLNEHMTSFNRNVMEMLNSNKELFDIVVHVMVKGFEGKKKKTVSRKTKASPQKS